MPFGLQEGTAIIKLAHVLKACNHFRVEEVVRKGTINRRPDMFLVGTQIHWEAKTRYLPSVAIKPDQKNRVGRKPTV